MPCTTHTEARRRNEDVSFTPIDLYNGVRYYDDGSIVAMFDIKVLFSKIWSMVILRGYCKAKGISIFKTIFFNQSNLTGKYAFNATGRTPQEAMENVQAALV
ncbi:hypothetical protein MUCCIDRAFT_157992 [Mucor lusitanicus CBS 277.49]|uniref:Uncharacterized protein n=1 Tax=Mucor lusitanicus CBS 277.49 TaxID=747725 RepID=A0A162RPA8_MUCCL|nr:hypothetical protein MUCCIDRAFT_157992 [Mucor lusitanicus CBS 277.49]